MDKKRVKFSCSLDCYDICSMIALVKDDRVVQIMGDKEHPLTQGLICVKGRKHLERLYHPERLLNPKKRVNNGWIDITYEEAIDEIVKKLTYIKKEYGSQAVLHYFDYGYGGLSKTVDEMFFNHYGGATIHRGSLCWGAGIKAQKYDFGDTRSHTPEDLLNSKTIIIWGRNPADTNVHMVKYLIEAKRKGTDIYVIDPIKTNTAKIASEYARIKPSTDGALALGMANVIINSGLVDKEFVNEHVEGFDKYREYVQKFTPDYVEGITGIHKDKIREIATKYAENKPSSIIIGYGLQRYENGGNNVRCIDALGAITGNIGIKGGGVNYSNSLIGKYIRGEVEKSYEFVENRRTYSKTKLAEFILNGDNPPVKCLFITRSNPLVQVPNINKTIEAFKKVEFKVVIDMFMTDTARYANLVLPTTSILEEEDFIYSSMFSPYLNYSAQVVKPRNNIMGEYELFKILAEKMELKDYPTVDKEEFFRRALKPLMENFNITYDSLKNSYFTIENVDVPWQDKKFNTPSGKYELYSELAEKDGLNPIPVFILPKERENNYNMRLITPHYKGSIHSQHFAFTEEMPTAHVNGRTLKRNNLDLDSNEIIKIESKYGEIAAKLKVDENIGDDIVMIYEGWWHKSGSVNFLTPDKISDMGEQTAYYECFCTIKKLDDN